MRFLLTNDDGIYAKGLSALYDELSREADCLIVAPEIEQSAVGHAITIFRPLMVRRATKNGKFLGYAVYGTPADCVHIGVSAILSERPQLIVSGINKGGNLGDDITYSGTVSAAFEGTLLGIPSFAISLVSRSHFKFHPAARFAVRVDKCILKKGLPEDTLLNVNVPNLDEREIKSYQITQQGRWIHICI